jgi:hypothetical protein
MNAQAALRKLALSYPETQEGMVCERSAFKARNRSFLFMGQTEQGFDIMVKLGPSLATAANLAAKQPQSCKVGANGWVTASFHHDQAPPPGLLEAWIDESFRLLAHKQLVAMLPGGGPAPAPKARKKKKATSR